jgi:hypothetical protein
MLRQVLAGAAAGAAGTTALNALTFADMALRGRSASSTPEQTVEALAARAPTDVPGDGVTRDNRVSGLASLMGLATGVAVGAVYGAVTSVTGRPTPWLGAGVLGLGAMIGGNVPMARLGVSDPRTWDTAAWVSDILPHAAYGAVTAFAFEGHVDAGSTLAPDRSGSPRDRSRLFRDRSRRKRAGRAVAGARR